VTLARASYAYFAVLGNPAVTMRHCRQRVTGLLTVWKGDRPADFRAVGGELFDWWRPRRRPDGQNLACVVAPPVAAFGVDNLRSGELRPTHRANAWVADPHDPQPAVTLTWPEPQTLRRIELWFDPDYDHPMESVLWGHPESVVPFMVKAFSVLADNGQGLAEIDDNHETRRVLEWSAPVRTRQLTVRVRATHGALPAIFEVRCYS
jgi:hypothetical protein